MTSFSFDWLFSGSFDLPLVLAFVFASVAAIAIAWALFIKRTMAREAELLQLVQERTVQLEEANRRLEALSYIDALTNVANRRAFDDALDVEWRRAVRSKQPLSLLLLDVDHFKAFNDTYGHQAGDHCLTTVAESFGTIVRRAGDRVARYGGEEFAVLMPSTDRAGAQAIAERIRAGVEGLALAHERTAIGRVTISVGCATMVASDALSPEILIATADAALYQAKRGGRNRVETAAAVQAIAPGNGIKARVAG